MKVFILILISILLSGDVRGNDIYDSVVTLMDERKFSDRESKFISDHSMSKLDMYRYAKNAFDYSEIFSKWLKSNQPDIYKIDVMNEENYPHSDMSLHNGGLVDAFRHIFWTALIAQEYGRTVAEEFTDLHERIQYGSIYNRPGNKVILKKDQVEIFPSEWKFYELYTTDLHSELKVTLDGSNDDISLFVRKGIKPTKTEFDCFGSDEGNVGLVCNMDLWQSAYYYIGVYGREEGQAASKFNVRALLLDDKPDGDDLEDGLTPMDYHNNYIGALIGSKNKYISNDKLSVLIRGYILEEKSLDLDSYNSHTLLPQNRIVIYDSLSNGSSKLHSSFHQEMPELPGQPDNVDSTNRLIDTEKERLR